MKRILVKRKWYQKLYPFYVFMGLVLAWALSSCHKGTELNDKQIMSKVVRVLSEEGMCTGEQVKAPSGENYILTASHCKILGKDGLFKIKNERGLISYVHQVAEDDNSDLLLLEGMPNMEGIHIAHSTWRNQHVNTFTHASNLDTFKTSGVLINTQTVPIPIFEIHDAASKAECDKPKYRAESSFADGGTCFLETELMFSTAFTTHGSSGGPVVNMDGELVGVVSGGGYGYSLFVRLYDIKQFLKDY